MQLFKIKNIKTIFKMFFYKYEGVYHYFKAHITIEEVTYLIH
jgi:hypothetical protein